MEEVNTNNQLDMYDLPKSTVRIEDLENLAIISLEELEDDQTIDDSNLYKPIHPTDEDFIYDDETPYTVEDGISEDDELSVFEEDEDDSENEDDEDFDDTGYSDDDYEDMSEDMNYDE